MKTSLHLIFFLVLLAFSGALPAQDFSKTYQPLCSTGKLPPIFVKSYSQKIQEEFDKINDPNYFTLNRKKEFTAENNFNVDRILRAGNVLYNDSIGAYVNKVLDEILRDKPEVRSKIQLFVIKSPQVNAFSFDNGVILVNSGLISQLENESQLAFILCHELIHYLRHHSITAYLDFVNVSKGGYSHSESRKEDMLKYSKDQEAEADTAGLQLFKATKYDYHAVHTAFDVLQYSYLPFDEQEFSRDFLEDKNLKFPAAYWLDKTAEIKAEDNYDDSKSTHPNIRKRVSNLEQKLDSSLVNTGRKQFIVSEAEFNHARDLARFETCRLYLLDLDYPNAIYSAYLLLKKHPDNLYLKHIVGKALYEIASYKSYKYGLFHHISLIEKESRYELKDYDKVEGYSQQVYHLLNKLSAEEMNVLALNYNWKLNASLNYSDKTTNRICDSLLLILTRNNEKQLGDYSKKSKAEVLHEDSVHLAETELKIKTLPEKSGPDTSHVRGEPSKYVRIKAEQQKKEINDLSSNEVDEFSKYAFVDLFKDDKFLERFQYYTDKNTKEKAETRDAPVTSNSDRLAKEKKYGQALGIQKVLLLDPFYYKLSYKKEKKLDFNGTTKGLSRFREALRVNAAKAGLDFVSLDPKTMGEKDVAQYNDFVNANDWMNERIEHGYNTQALVSSQENKDSLVAHYGTHYVMFTGVVSFHRQLFVRDYTYVYAVLYDMDSETPLMAESRELRMRDRKSLLNSNFYDIFHQMKEGVCGGN
jgi:hypothetical protein